jgi:serine/threonine protein kinase
MMFVMTFPCCFRNSVQILDFLGSAAFSRAVQALDLKTGMLVCLKIIKNNKDYFDQSLDEIKLLKYVNAADPTDSAGILQMYDYFYYKEHLFIVCELLRANLYEFQKYNRDSGEELYFVLPRLQVLLFEGAWIKPEFASEAFDCLFFITRPLRSKS